MASIFQNDITSLHPTNLSCVNSQRISANGNWIALVQIEISISPFCLYKFNYTRKVKRAIRFYARENLKTNVKKYVPPWTDDSIAPSTKTLRQC